LSVQSRTATLTIAALACASCAGSAMLFADFIAEDAYILYRYVENVFRLGSLVYNAEDRINALTSPLHALIMTVLYAATDECAVTARVVGLALLLVTAGGLALRFRSDPPVALFSASLVALPSCAVLWAYGGLETPWLMALVAVSALHSTRPRASAGDTYLQLVLAGLGFLARYDAALFFAPLALHALLREPANRHRLGAVLAGAALPLAWLATAYAYYGDIFPTSFYIKPPGFGLSRLLDNAQYVMAWTILAGLFPAGIAWCLHGGTPFRRRFAASVRAHWPLYFGVCLELAYTLTMATNHMMFSFRAFTPYIPAVAIVLAQSLHAEREGGTSVAGTAVLVGFVALASIGHAAHSWHTYDRSINGLSPVGEMRHMGSRDWMRDFMGALWQQADAIRRDWPTRPAAAARPPRIGTYAGGVVPYAVPEAYVYEALASYRHGRPQYNNYIEYCDYGMVVTPHFGPVEKQLRFQPERFQLIFERTITFEGQPQSLRVYYNPRPDPHPLGNRIDRPDATPR
jgi:arabinofuranosyltransferase